MMSITNKLLLILITMTLAACSGSGGQLRPEDVPPVAEQGTTPEYRLGSGDVVSVSVWKNPDLSVTVPVRPDGFISVPLVGDVLAGGRTPAEISADTEGKLLQFIRSPQVSIIVEELNSAEFRWDDGYRLSSRSWRSKRVLVTGRSPVVSND